MLTQPDTKNIPSKSSSFRFLNYKVNKVLIEYKNNIRTNKLRILITPSGVIIKNENTYLLMLSVKISDRNTVNMEIEVVGKFEFNDLKDKNINTFFYINAPAILFPYIRAYISTISTLSGNKSMILPTLNLTGLGKQLKDNTKIK